MTLTPVTLFFGIKAEHGAPVSASEGRPARRNAARGLLLNIWNKRDVEAHPSEPTQP